MKMPRRISLFRSFKLAPFSIIALFLFANLTGIFFNRVFAPADQTVKLAFDENYIPADIPSSGDGDLDLIIFRAGVRHGVDPRLIHAVIWRESRYQANTKSPAGAQGMMQLMPATGRRFGCTEASDVASNVEAGTRYLRWLLKRFDGDISLTLAAYNAGEGTVDKYEGVPPYNETQDYVREITCCYGRTYHPVLSPEQARVEFGLLPQIAQLQR